MSKSRKIPIILLLVFGVLFASFVVGYGAGKQLAKRDNDASIEIGTAG